MTSPAWIGSYRIERLLGTGSFATVWLGFDPSLGARVAIKVLAENWSHDLRVRERFRDEARLLWRLDHERVVRVHSLGELPDGRPYLVMAWAEGGSLRERLAAGPMAVTSGLALLREITAGVAVLHGHGIVHRDLTPGNVLFPARPGSSPVDRVVIADLGLAKELAAASGLTARAGTPGYMAPEQDDPMSIVDTRTDVYGLGRLGMAILGVPALRQPASLGRLRVGVPAGVVEVLRTATAHRPADRYPDAAAFGTALAQAVAAGPRAGWRRAGVVVLAAVAALAADSARPGGPAIATDPTGRIRVTLPAGWHAGGSRWSGQLGSDGQPEPALVISPEPDRWLAADGGPGAFVGLSRGIAARNTPEGFVAERPHAGCVAAPVRVSRQAGIDWVIAGFSSCPGARPVIVEAAGSGPGGLAYVQIAPPDGAGPGFVDGLLAGVRVW